MLTFSFLYLLVQPCYGAASSFLPLHKEELFILSTCHQGECFHVGVVEEVREPPFECLLLLPWCGFLIPLIPLLFQKLPFIEESEGFPADPYVLSARWIL